MDDHEKTQDQLIQELAELRQEVAELEAVKAGLLSAEKNLYQREQLLRSILAGLIGHGRKCSVFGMNRSTFINRPQ